MDTRLNIFQNPVISKMLKHLTAAGKAVQDSGLPPQLQHLVELRISQINGCGPCIDMHTKELTAAGADATRIHLVAAWPEATVYSDAERAAFALAEAGTRVADGAGGASDEVWDNAAKHFDEGQLGALVAIIGLLNAFNRMNVLTRQPAGDYRAGEFA